LSLETVTDYDKTTYLGFTPLVGTSSGSDLLGIKSLRVDGLPWQQYI